MSCGGNLGKYRWFYTGNQVGDLNHTGDFNFAAGGPAGSGISAGTTVKRFFAKEISRNLWEYPNARLTQELLDACFPFIELQWIADIKISNAATFRVSDRNIYVTDSDGLPRFYEARVPKAPSISITLGEWLSPNFEIGDFKLELNNRDGFFNDYLPQGTKYLQWIGAEVSIKVGFGEDLSNYYEIFKGFVSNKQGVTGTHESIVIKCYDRQVEDEVLIPAVNFDRTNYPDVDADSVGKVLPIVYGDWSEEVGDYGEIPAICSNANDELTQVFNWQISENALIEIGDVYLHRGENIVGKDGPIKLLNSAITKQPEFGRILVPNIVPVLERACILLDRARSAAGSGLKLIVSESPSLDFIRLGIRVGDVVLIDGDPTNYVITSVSTGTIGTASGSFPQNTNYRVITDKYNFKKGDKLSVFCKGKDLKIMSTTKISDSSLLGADPLGVSIGLDNSYWFTDNTKKKIYQVSFDNKVLKTIDFAAIDPSITFISALDVAFDGTLWIVQKSKSKIYRYLLKDERVGLSFTTLQVSGINALLNNISGLCIDDANILTICDNTTGKFYRFNPFAAILTVQNTFNRSVFNSNAKDIVDISADVNKNHLLVLDRATNKVYRLNETTGVEVSSFNVTTISSNFTYPRGIGYYLDGTLFILNRNDNIIYNYNEFTDSHTNIGFITRDLLQKYAGRTTFDFDLMWNQTCREDLSKFKARVYINETVSVISHVHKLLQSFNTSTFIRFQKYALFHIAFDNFVTDGDTIREGDIKLNSFNPSKEYNQYFNVCMAKYNSLPFSDVQNTSDIYASPSGIKMSGREITKEIDLSPVYKREDIDKLVPLFVRLAAAEPEFINMSVGFRFLFTQPNTFFNIRFFDYDVGKKTGRRYDNIPCFVRKIEANLANMEFKLKVWSLGTTQFGNFVPVGTIAGGQNDQIVLTNLGTPGYIAPIGTITSASANQASLQDVNAVNAENRSDGQVGKAWKAGFVVSVVNGATKQVVQNLIIQSVSGSTITFTTTPSIPIQNTIKNSAGFIVGGHYLQYANYNDVIEEQTIKFCYFTKPYEGYPTTTTSEIEELRAGKMNFEDQRLPYLLHPSGYTPIIN